MSEMKLKPGVYVSFDEKKHQYEFTFAKDNIIRQKKVTSRAFANLIGANQWESVGFSVLERHNLTEKQDIDEYYTVRGEIAERLVYDFLIEHYKKLNVELKLKTWDKNEISYDNFPKNKKYGGMIDIAIASPQEYRAVVEVKSKSLKDFDKIKKNRGNPEEVWQGKFLARLAQVDKCLMSYCFFTEEQENKIKELMADDTEIDEIYKEIGTDFDYKNILMMKFNVGVANIKSYLEEQMQRAYKKLVDFNQTRTLNESQFTHKENAYLQVLCGNDKDLPF